MPAIRGLLDEHADRVIDCWQEEAGKSTGAVGLSPADLVSRLPAFVGSLLRASDSPDADGVTQRWLIDSHLSDRLRQGFELPEMIEEFRILGRCIEALWSGTPVADRPDAAEIAQLHAELSRGADAASLLFREEHLEHRQSERRFLRRLQQIASDAMADGAATPQELRPHEMLDVIAGALRAQTTGLYYYEAEHRQLRLVASTGVRDDLEGKYVTPLGAPSFASRLADSPKTLYLADVARSGLELPEPLRKAGTRSILGMPLQSRGVLFGALYVGALETRLFAPWEVRMFESLGERFAQLLDIARVHGDLNASNQKLRTEREMRERFVAVLAHDLLGPLAAARMGIQLLLTHPQLIVERGSVPTQILKDLDRTDAMVRDLLDVHQIRAGHRLTLRLAKTDLIALVSDVVQELQSLHGDRFQVTSAEHLWGFWSARDLRRAVWNLASNAIKYGGKTTPVAIDITSTPSTANVAVRNEGPPIAPHERAALFEPFNRSVSIQAAAERGWGLGLTLVKGCADAHGGTIAIESEASSGTTFTLRLPHDARPFQPTPESVRD